MRGRRVLAVASAVCLGIGTAMVPTTAAARPQQSCVANPAEVAGKAPAAESTSSELPLELMSKLDTAAQESLKATAAPGAIVGVRTPQGTWTKAFGLADPATQEAMTTDMHSRIGSVTKTFTGTVILQLAQEGKLSLSDPIGKYYKGIPNGDQITLEQLLNMTSGIASYYTDAFLDRYYSNPTGTFTPDELISYGVSGSPLFEPGEMFNYSNTNTILLGKVIEAVTGQPVQEVFAQRIYEPLGMTNSSLPDVSLEIPQPHPQGFTLQGAKTPGQPENATNWNPSFGWTAGAMISSLRDMLTYTRALGTGQDLLSKQTQVQRLESMRAPTGYGLGIVCFDGWIGHTGELPGFNTTAYYDTTTDTAVVVMVNSDIAAGDCTESPTLADTPTGQPCSSPATRVFVAVSEALGHVFPPPPTK